MRNLGLLFSTFILLITATTISIAQPRLTVWRVAADHQDNHEHNVSVDDKIEYDCGAYYYMTHTGKKIDMHFALRNDGSEDLNINLPIKMSVLSSDFLAVTSDASTGTLAPGEETMITISYLNTGDYVPGQRGIISFSSNDFINPLCGFSIEVGGTNPNTYCVCEEGEKRTIDLLPGAPGDESGTLVPIQPNQFKLHPGPCTEEDECPAEESLACYYTPFIPNFRTAIAGNLAGAMAPSAAEFYLELSPGYCPCIIETDFCVSSEDIPTLAEIEGCVGDPKTYEVFNCWEMDGAKDHGDLTLPEEYSYEWCTDGIGTFSNNMGMEATITGWFPSDYIFVKVTNEEGCIGVGWREAPYVYNSRTIELQNDRDVCIQDDLVLCLNVYSTLGSKRQTDNSRSDGVVWSTNGDGIFSNPVLMEGQHCITISGMKFGDKVYAVDHQGPVDFAPPGECPPYGIYNSTFRGPNPCTEVFENLGLGGIDLDDPCNCLDPLNIPPPGPGVVTLFFHDILTIENLQPFEDVEIDPGVNFLDQNGNPILVTIEEQADMWGRIELDFWHAPGMAALAEIFPEVSDPTTFTSSICESCIPIPTLSQWGLIILGMMVFILGILFIKSDVRKIIPERLN